MPRFFFDIHNRIVTHDHEGIDLPDLAAVPQETLRCLPTIAADELPRGSDRRHFTVVVSDADGIPIYTATLTYTGQWLLR